MTKFVKDMLMSKYGRGDKHYAPHYPEHEPDYRRDYRYDGTERDMRRSDYGYKGQGFANQTMGYEPDRQYHDYRRYDMSRYDYGEDYGEMEYGKMSHKDIEKWSEALENSDGTRGKHFKKDQVDHAIKQIGADVHKYGGAGVFCMAMNMMYADYCGVAKKFGADTPVFYAEMAKAFLDDKDFRGKGEEKLWLYYKCIAEQED